MRRAIGDSIFGYMRVKAWISAGFALLICGGFLIGGLVSLFNALDFYIDAGAAEGRVIEVVESNHPTDKRVDRFYYASRIAFRTADGRAVTWQETDIDEMPSYKVGDAVTMLYSTDNPSDARIYTLDGMFGSPLTYLGIGLGLLFVFVPRLFLMPFGDLGESAVNLIVSATICAVGLGLLANTWLYTLQTRVADGRVVELIELHLKDKENAGYTSYRPRVAFQAEDGNTYSFKLGRAHRTPNRLIGDIVRVRYPVDDPTRAAPSNESTLWFPAGAAIAFGLFYLVMSFSVDLYYRGLRWLFYGNWGRRRAAPQQTVRYRPPAYEPPPAQAYAPPPAAATYLTAGATPSLRMRDLRAAGGGAAAAIAAVPDDGPSLLARLWDRLFGSYASLGQRIYLWAAMAVSMAVIAVGLLSLLHTLHFYTTAESAEGRVVDRVEQRISLGPTDRFLIANRIAFTGAAGRELTFVTDAAKEPHYAVGQTIPVLYNAYNHRDIRIDSFLDVF